MRITSTDRAYQLVQALHSTVTDKLQRRIYLAALLAAALLVTLIWRGAHEANELIKRTGKDELTTYSQAIQLNVMEALNLADYTLKRARNQWLSERTVKTHEEYFEDFPNFKALITQIAIIDKDGHLVSSSLNPKVPKTWLGDREHYRVHLNTTSDAIFISTPLEGRISNNMSVQFTRPIFNADRVFEGVVVISLDPTYIADTLFKRAGLAEIRVLLLGTDGRVRVQASMGSTHDAPVIESPALMPVGSAWAKQSVNDIHDFYWQTNAVEGYALTLEVGVPKQRIDMQIARTNQIAWALTTLLLLALFAYTGSILRLVRDRNTLLQRLEESKIKANSANAMKSKFVSSISHELRTPLNGILGFSELIGMSDNLEEAKKYGKTVNKSADHLHQLVNTLLDLAKIEAGQMEVTRIQSSVRDICESVTSIHRYSMKNKGLLFNLNFDTSLPKTIYTDHIKLMQILNNLINNAVKFTDEGAIFLSVAFSDHRWHFTVADTGIGMTPQQLKNMFTRFNNIKMDESDSATRQGAGLGMALCKELIELLGGEIDVQSEHKVGTAVKFYIPDLHDDKQH